MIPVSARKYPDCGCTITRLARRSMTRGSSASGDFFRKCLGHPDQQNQKQQAEHRHGHKNETPVRQFGDHGADKGCDDGPERKDGSGQRQISGQFRSRKKIPDDCPRTDGCGSPSDPLHQPAGKQPVNTRSGNRQDRTGQIDRQANGKRVFAAKTIRGRAPEQLSDSERENIDSHCQLHALVRRLQIGGGRRKCRQCDVDRKSRSRHQQPAIDNSRARTQLAAPAAENLTESSSDAAVFKPAAVAMTICGSSIHSSVQAAPDRSFS